MSIPSIISRFAAIEDGGFTLDWAMQAGVVALVSFLVLASVDSGDEISSTGHTHHNGYTITSQYP